MKLLFKLWIAAMAMAISVPVFAQIKKANKDYELGAYNLAVRSYLELLEKRPANYEAMVNLADAYRHLNQMDDARSWYEKVIKESKLASDHLFNYAQVLMALGEYGKAREWFIAYSRADKANAAKGNHYAQSCTFAQNQVGQSSPYLVSNEFINTTASDFGPAFFGDQVAFASARTDIVNPSAGWTGKANNQLFMARIGTNGFLDAPVLIQSRVRTDFVNIGPVAFTADGKWVAYTKNNFVDGTRHIPTESLELSLSISQINPNGEWVEDKAFPYNGGFDTGYPCFAPDGNALYFASDRPDGFGGFDIYVSYKMGNTWSAPENMGPVVNSPGNEVSPYFDGANLYFSSDWHQGMGGYDIFRAEQANGRWARVFHLGNVINSSYDDYGFTYDTFRNIGYMVSNRPGGRGNEDIYKVFKSADNIVLNVRNASDGTPIPGATVDFTNCGEGFFKTDTKGMYSFQAVEGLSCDITVRADGYRDAVFSISTAGVRQNREYDVLLSKRGEEYVGKILNYSSRLPVAGVTVTATNLGTRSTVQAQTDVNGDYALALSANSSYIIHYSRPGFREFDRNIQTKDGMDRTILGVISMLPVSGAEGNFDNITNNENATSSGSNTAVSPSETGEAALPSGYAVQVAALSQPGLDNFNSLSSFGQVYSKYEAGKYKIRVGVFQSKDEANRILNSVKSKGYSGAFIVAEAGTGGVTIKGANSASSSSTTTTPTNSTATSNAGRYKVQLAAYKDPRWFNPASIQGLGDIEDRYRDGFTVKYLGSYQDIEQAKAIWQKVKAAGFSTAFVVVETNGELTKVYP